MTESDFAASSRNWEEILDKFSQKLEQAQCDVVGLQKLRFDLKSNIDLIPHNAPQLQLRAASILADTLTQLGLHSTAYDVLSEALEFNEVSGQNEDSGLRMALASAAIKSKRQEECLELLDSSDMPEEYQAGNVLAAGELLTSLDRQTEAAQRLKDFADHQWPPSLSLVGVLQQLGVFLDESGQSLEALSMFRRAFSILQMLSESKGLQNTWSSGLHNSMSVCLLNLGRIDEAAREADEAIVAAQSANSFGDLAVALLSRGNACEAGGQTEIALMHFHEGLVASARSGRRNYEITLLNNIALCYLELAQSDLYVRHVLWALDVAEELEDWRSKALALCNLSALSTPVDARVMLTEAYALYLRLGSRAGQAAVLHRLADVAQKEGYEEDALEHAADALEIAKKVLDPQLLVICHGQMGSLLVKSDPETAWNAFIECLSWADVLRRETDVAEVRLHIMENLDTLIDAAIKLAVEQAEALDQQERNQWLERLFTILERARARVMLDQIESHGGRAQVALPHDLRDEAAGLRNRIRALRDILGAVNTAGATDDIRATVAEDLGRTRQRLAEIHAFLAQSNRQFNTLTSAAPIGSGWLATVVPSNVAVLTFAEVAGNLISLIYANGKFALRKQPGLEEIRQLDRSLRDACVSLKDLKTVKDLCSKLGQDVLEPVLDLCSLGNISHLLVIPLPKLFSVPLDGYIIKGRYLFERFSVSYLPSVSVAQHLSDMPQPGRGLVIGDPDNTLPYARQEALEVVDSLDSFIRSDVLIGPSATKSKLFELAPNVQVLHIASHAEFMLEAPDFARIALAGERGDQEKDLEVADVMNMDLPAVFVVLSGCNTGLGTTDASNEMIGLVRSFFIAGASGVIATRWPVRDASTSEFMRLFYRHLIADDEHPAEALRNARAEHIGIGGYAHPGYWAAFTHFGVPPGWKYSVNELFVED
jgi:CHAT domain-containing protein